MDTDEKPCCTEAQSPIVAHGCEQCTEVGIVPDEETLGPLLYVKRALTHPYHVLALAGMAVFCLVTGNPFLLVLGLAIELFYLRVVPRSARFRSRVDARVEASHRLAAARAREAQLAQIDLTLRQRLERLDLLVEQIRTNGKIHGEMLDAAVLSDSLDPARLTSSYLRLAIAHKTYGDYLLQTNRHAIENDVQTMEDAQRLPCSERTHQLRQRRLSIARKRIERWERTREKFEAVSHQLSAIEELVQLLHERSITPREPEYASSELDRFLTELEEHEGTWQELSQLEEDDEQSSWQSQQALLS